ncbi:MULTISPECIES: hypothetical protein [unclassified Endozoicomonas]|uniref:hypothetical protein n=1 Tax=unclassified Endozoicomonas TaxID=2644528 RepID=UPI003BB81157
MSPLTGTQPLPRDSFTTPESKKEKAVDKRAMSIESKQSLPQSNQRGLSDYNIKVDGKRNAITVGAEGKMHDEYCAKCRMAADQQNNSNTCVSKKEVMHDYRQDGIWSWGLNGVNIAGYPQCPVPGCAGHIPEGAMLIGKHWR